MSPDRSSFNILQMEANPADAHLVERVPRKSRFPTQLSIVDDGIPALTFLKCIGVYPDAICLDLILPDLKLPSQNGHQVLKEVKTDREPKKVPVEIFRTLIASKDIKSCYQLGANSYVRKPIDRNAFFDVEGILPSERSRTRSSSGEKLWH